MDHAFRAGACGSVRRWALAGAIWGLLSLLLDFGGLFTCMSPLYRLSGEWQLGISLLFPSRWVRHIYILSDPSEGVLNVWPAWACFAFIVAWSVALATFAALGLRLCVGALRRFSRKGTPGTKHTADRT